MSFLQLLDPVQLKSLFALCLVLLNSDSCINSGHKYVEGDVHNARTVFLKKCLTTIQHTSHRRFSCCTSVIACSTCTRPVGVSGKEMPGLLSFSHPV